MKHHIIPCVEGDDALIAEQLDAIAVSKIRFDDPIQDELVVFKVVDGDGSLIAGCNLLISCWRVAELDILWVAEAYRRQGIGSALIREAERAARERGCHAMTLGTFDFQAKPLYERFGFTEYGRNKYCPTVGHTHYDMVKQLDPSVSESAAPCPFEIVPGSEEDAEFIDDQLVEYNWSKVPAMRDFAWIGRKICSNDGTVIAGCFAGVNFWNIAFLEMLWVDEPCRNQGKGSELLAEIEREVKQLGASLVLIDAREWNVEFFQKNGYSVYGIFENNPQGCRKYRLQKRL